MLSSLPIQRNGLIRIDHELTVPVDRLRPDGAGTRVFAREVYPVGADREKLPMLVYLTGGPGSPAPRPHRRKAWLDKALERYRVLLLDQRGTGRSDPIDVAALWSSDATELTDRLSHYRADSIVADAEDFRRALLGEDGRWSLLGQSFGGFCALTYLSQAPQALESVMITGGLPSLDRPALDVYRACFRVLARKVRAYLRGHPGDEAILRELLELAKAGTEELVDGRLFTLGQARQLGNGLGFSSGSDALHGLLESAFVVGEGGRRTLSTRFRQTILNHLPFGLSPIYAVLHEPIYAQGEASGWAAQRALDELSADGGWPEDLPLLTAEMVLPSVFDEVPALKPLKEVAERLARKDDWPRLYDPEVLAANRVPVAAVAYAEDLYVPLVYSQETADRVGGLRLWITNEYEHDGVTADGPRVLGRLWEMLEA